MKNSKLWGRIGKEEAKCGPKLNQYKNMKLIVKVKISLGLGTKLKNKQNIV